MNNSLHLLWEWFTSPVISGTFFIAGAGIVLAILFFTLTNIAEKLDKDYLFGISFALGIITVISTIIALFSFSAFGGAQ